MKIEKCERTVASSPSPVSVYASVVYNVLNEPPTIPTFDSIHLMYYITRNMNSMQFRRRHIFFLRIC